MLIKHKIEKFCSLSIGQKLKFLIYFFLYPLFILIFRLAGYKKTWVFINKAVSISKATTETNKRYLLTESSLILNAANNSLFKSTCLEKSLFIYFVLGIYGSKCDLKVGVDNTTDEFSAHAWVMYGNTILNDSYENIEKLKEIHML